MKPGELERNLSRLVEAARTAGERLAAMEQELAALRLEMENLAAGDSHGGTRRERVETTARAEGDRPGREAGSE